MLHVPHASLFGWELGHLNRRSQLGVCCAGIFFFFCCYGFLQEYIFRIEGFHFGWFLTFIQKELIMEKPYEGVFFNISDHRAPLSKYLSISFFMVATMGMSNTACTYLPYPTQVVFKSSKLIPVMIGGRLILGRRFHLLEYLSAVLIALGLASLTLADVSQSLGWDPTGVMLLMGALVGDAFISNLQEKVMKECHVSQHEMVLFSHVVGSGYLLVLLVFSGQLWEGLSFCVTRPSTVIAMTLFAAFGYVGVHFVLAAINLFGSFTAMTVTSLRKALTISLSFLIFPKPFSLQYFGALLLVFGGIGLQLYHKRASQGSHGFPTIQELFSQPNAKLHTIKIV